MFSIKFLGASGGVTGSCYLLEFDGKKILVDFGLFQGEDEEKNFESLQFSPREIDAVFITHGHLDHCGRIPILAREGFSRQIFATHSTIEIAKIVLLDAAKLQEEGAFCNSKGILFTTKDCKKAIKLFQKVRFCKKLKFSTGVTFEFIPAGHILGASSIIFEFEKNGKKESIIFSGDLGSRMQKILDFPKPPKVINNCILETTYGSKFHSRREETEKELFKIIKDTIKRGGKVLIPSFSVERTQEILNLFSEWAKDKRRKFDYQIYLDSPMGSDVTRVYKSNFVEFSSKFKRIVREPKKLFDFPNLNVVKSNIFSKKISEKNKCIIISGSGMMNGGRILYHLSKSLENPNNSLVIIGYQASGTLGREIVEGKKVVKIFGEEKKVLLKTFVLDGFSAHADQSDLLKWISGIKNIKRIFLTHGEDESRKAMKQKILELNRKAQVFSPNYLDLVEI